MTAAPSSLPLVEPYFAAWTARDPDAVAAAFAEGGSYTGPTVTGPPLTGTAIAEHALRDGDQPPDGMPAEIRALAVAARIQSHRLLRVVEALRAASREDDVDRLYRLWGGRVFVPSWPPAPPRPDLIGEIVTVAGLPAGEAAPRFSDVSRWVCWRPGTGH